MPRWLAICMLVWSLPAASTAAPDATPGQDFLARLEAGVARGELTAEQALLYQFAYGFAPETLPPAYRPASFAPLKCGTIFLQRYEREKARLGTAAVKQIEAWLTPAAGGVAKAVYNSPGGRFTLAYDTAGEDAVPAADVDPANGVPDYVERVASYCDLAWAREIDELGFVPPPLGTGRYQIFFESMQYYGYTAPLSYPAGATRITLHNNYLGFPPNDDPEGSQWGAAKATVAHEFKHASQRATSLWSEGDWVELDATWAEDIVFDDVNDYYNYLGAGSPLSAPSLPLDDGGGGSYEDCLWQHWLSETWGEQAVVALWERRRTHQSEAMIDSYGQLLLGLGSSLTAGWPVYATWNYATGARAAAGFGYGEAAGYPTALVVTALNAYPATVSGAVPHLAAAFVRCDSVAGRSGAVTVVFDGAGGIPASCTAVITRTDGAVVTEPLALDATGFAATALATPLAEMAALGFAIGNAEFAGGGRPWELTVALDLPEPALTATPAAVVQTLASGRTGQVSVSLLNSGEAGSRLAWSATLMATPAAQQEPLPTSAPPPTAETRSVAGSTVFCSPAFYVPGGGATLTLTATNLSPDGERLSEIVVDFPDGVTVTGSTDFVGGSGGPLASDGAVGAGASVRWYDANGGWGNVYGAGEMAVATVSVAFDGGLSGGLSVPYAVTGDQYGSAPHVASGWFGLAPPPSPSVTMLTPNGGELWAAGSVRAVSWLSTGSTPVVDLELSRDGGHTWQAVAAATPDDGAEEFTVPGPATARARLRVSVPDGSLADASDGDFRIYEPVAWATAAPASGVIPAGQSAALTLEFDATLLAPGAYGALLLLRHDGAEGETALPVTLRVEPSTSDTAHPPAALRWEGNHPNPFNPRTLLAFTLPAAGPAVVEIFDAGGRRVRALWRGPLPAGRSTVVWDGRDDAGRDVAAGAYLARLRGAGAAVSHKMVLTR